MKTVVTLCLLLLLFDAPGFLFAQEGEELSEEQQQEILESVFNAADYILIGKVKSIKALGPSGAEGETPKWFYRLEISPGEHVLGDWRADAKKEMENAGLEFPDDWTFTSLYWIHDDAFTIDDDTDCLVVLNKVKAGTMAGLIPVTIAGVNPVDADELEFAKQLVAEKKEKRDN